MFERVQGGLGINILTTPKGVMTGRDAQKEGVGGFDLFELRAQRLIQPDAGFHRDQIDDALEMVFVSM